MAGRWILHVDLDQFLAAVEVLRRPELRGRAVVVGGDGNPRRPRQVVATASYEARAFGVRSGMPLAAALRRCPECVFLPSDKPVYEEASERVMAVLRSFPHEPPLVVEVWGWDEAFVGVVTDDPDDVAEALMGAVFEATELRCAVGIGDTRLTAKTATGFAKARDRSGPRIARLTRAGWIATMGDKPVTAIWGIGDRTAARLGDVGIETVEQLARADHHDLAARFGPTIGPSLRILGLGGDNAPLVDEPWVPKSRGKEVTYTSDLVDADAIAAEIDGLAREVTAEVVGQGRRITHVAVKVRTRTFFTQTKIAKLAGPTADADVAAAKAAEVLGRFEIRQPVRLLGVRLLLDPVAPTLPSV